jgi:hypothetical protein
MVWYAVYDSALGTLLSEGTVLANPLPPGHTAVDVGSEPNRRTHIWDEASHAFVPRPARKLDVERARLEPLYRDWQRWKITHAEAVARAAAAAVLTALLNKTNEAWSDYASAINDWRNAS